MANFPDPLTAAEIAATVERLRAERASRELWAPRNDPDSTLPRALEGNRRFLNAAEWLIAKAIETGHDLHMLDCAVTKDAEARGTTDDATPLCTCGLDLVMPTYEQARELGIEVNFAPKEGATHE